MIQYSEYFPIRSWFDDSVIRRFGDSIFEFAHRIIEYYRISAVFRETRDTPNIRIYSVIFDDSVREFEYQITKSSNHERIGKYSLYRIIESPNIESWRIFLIFDWSNIESPNRFGDRILNQDSMIRYSVIEYRILRITEYSMIRYP